MKELSIEITQSYVREILKPRDLNSHKGNYGRLLILAGSYGMAGACVLATSAASKGGAGLITVATDHRVIPIVQSAVPEAMCKDVQSGVFKTKCDGVLIGPGLGTKAVNCGYMKEILSSCHGPIIIDADGINNLVRFNLLEDCMKSPGQIVLTPHIGEGCRLLNVETIRDREKAALEISRKYRCTTVLKGPNTLVATASGKLYVNTTGNPGLATGGTGDVLAGLISGLAVQGYETVDAAKSGVFLHGYSGDKCALIKGETSMTAKDLVDFLHVAFMDILTTKGR